MTYEYEFEVGCGECLADERLAFEALRVLVPSMLESLEAYDCWGDLLECVWEWECWELASSEYLVECSDLFSFGGQGGEFDRADPVEVVRQVLRLIGDMGEVGCREFVGRLGV